MMFTDTDRSLGDFKTHIRARSSENDTQLFRLLVADLNTIFIFEQKQKYIYVAAVSQCHNVLETAK